MVRNLLKSTLSLFSSEGQRFRFLFEPSRFERRNFIFIHRNYILDRKHGSKFVKINSLSLFSSEGQQFRFPFEPPLLERRFEGRNFIFIHRNYIFDRKHGSKFVKVIVRATHSLFLCFQ